LFLNPDTEVIDDSLYRMLEWLRSYPFVGAIGPCLFNADSTMQESCVQAFPTLVNQLLDADLLRKWFPRWKLWGTWPLLNPDKLSSAAEVDVISGACFMVRRSLFEAVGQFTDEYFMYSDDVDLSYKIHRAGYSIVCLTDCAVIHYGGGSSLHRNPSFAAVERRKAMAQFFERTRGPWCSVAYRAMVGGAALARMSIASGALLFAASDEGREGMRSVLTRWKSIFKWTVGMGGGGERNNGLA
jgi:GT2 family glycosyltransferase